MEDVTRTEAVVTTVVKLGGSVISDASLCDVVLRVIGRCASTHRLLVVPGGGRFADAVRELDCRVGLSDDAAHWMAVRAMDESARVVVDRLAGGRLVATGGEIADVHACGQIPVLAPSRWLAEADPLPHSWDVTSDSIAAWVAGRVGASRLVLVKPRGVRAHRSEETDGGGLALVDASFPLVLPDGLPWTILPADRVGGAFDRLLREETVPS
jgi:aspartokinase-like uncharacterized kinase